MTCGESTLTCFCVSEEKASVMDGRCRDCHLQNSICKCNSPLLPQCIKCGLIQAACKCHETKRISREFIEDFDSRFSHIAVSVGRAASTKIMPISEKTGVSSQSKSASEREVFFEIQLGADDGKYEGYLIQGGNGWRIKPIGPATDVPNKKYDFVYYHGDSFIYVGDGHWQIHEYAKGEFVICAGEVTFEGGKVKSWTNRSGHFLPHPAYADQAPPGFDRNLFFPAHAAAAAFSRRVYDQKIEEARLLSDDKKRSIDAFLKLVRDKTGLVGLQHLYDGRISKKDRDTVVKELNLGTKQQAIDKLLGWNILQRR